MTIPIIEDIEKTFNDGLKDDLPSESETSGHPAKDERIETTDNEDQKYKQDVGSKPSQQPVISLKSNLKSLKKCKTYVQDDLLKPTASMLDMVRCYALASYPLARTPPQSHHLLSSETVSLEQSL